MVRLLFYTALFASLAPSYLAAAEMGCELSGSVHAPGGAPIAGARVAVGASATRTDPQGHYALTHLAPGPASLTIAATGYQPQTLTVILGPGKTLAPTVTLGPPNVVVLGQVTVSEKSTDASLAFANQASAAEIKETVSGSALTQNGAQDAADSLKGTTGVTVTRAADGSNNITIRGLAAQYNRVTVDGQRQSNAGLVSAGGALDNLPPEILQSIEVTKSLTPDMDADAIGGVINLTTADASTMKKPVLEVKEQLAEEAPDGQLGTRSSLTAGGPVRLWGNHDAGVLFTLSYDDVYRDSQSLYTTGTWPDVTSPGPPPWAGAALPAFTKAVVYDAFDHRHRLSLLLNADTRVGDTFYYFKSNFTHDALQRTQAQQLFDVSQGSPIFLAPDYAEFSGVHLDSQGVYRESARTLGSFTVGEKTNAGRLHLSASAGFAGTEDRMPTAIYSDFLSADPFDVSYDTRGASLVPRLSFVDPSSPPGTDALMDPDQYLFNQLFIIRNLSIDANYSAQADLKLDLSDDPKGSYLKVGAKVTQFDRSVEQRRDIYDANPAAPFSSAGLDQPETPDFQGGAYEFFPLSDARKVAALLNTDPTLFLPDQLETALSSNGADYVAHETVWATYAMGRIAWGRFSALAGVRLEDTAYDIRARPPVFAGSGALLGFQPVSDGRDYLDVLPGLHLRYDGENNWILRASVNRTLKRPDFNDMAPTLSLNYPQFESRVGNPALKPYEATNVDLYADYFRENLGLFSGGLFYKEISNFQVDSQTLVQVGTLGQFLQDERVNGSTARIGGAEFSWQSEPWTIPGIAAKTSLKLTDTYTESTSYIPERPGETFPLPLQARDQASASLRIKRKNLTVTLGATYHTKMLDDVVAFGRDQYEQGLLDVDLGASWSIRKNLTATAAVQNATMAASRSYEGDPSLLAGVQFNALEASLGIDWKL